MVSHLLEDYLQLDYTIHHHDRNRIIVVLYYGSLPKDDSERLGFTNSNIKRQNGNYYSHLLFGDRFALARDSLSFVNGLVDSDPLIFWLLSLYAGCVLCCVLCCDHQTSHRHTHNHRH